MIQQHILSSGVLQVPSKKSTWINHTYLFFPVVISSKNTTVQILDHLDKFTSSRTI